MHRDVVDMLDQLRVLEPDVPGLRGTHRHLQFRPHVVEVADQFIERQIVAQQGLVADHDTYHVTAILVSNLHQFFHFETTLFAVAINPGAERHIESVLACQCRHLGQRALERIGTYGVGLAFQQGEIGIDLLDRGIDTLQRVVMQTHGRERKTLDHLRPCRLLLRTIHQRPQADGDCGDHRGDYQVGSGHRARASCREHMPAVKG